MDETGIKQQIELLVAEEHSLLNASEPTEGLSPAKHKRLEKVRSELERHWDLLRQLRAHEEFGLDPADASIRSASTVEEYEQ